MDPGADIYTLLAQKRDEILSIAPDGAHTPVLTNHRVAYRRGARNVRVFGSVARNEAREDSDLDILIDLEPGRSLLDVGGLAMDLSALSAARSTS